LVDNHDGYSRTIKLAALGWGPDGLVGLAPEGLQQDCCQGKELKLRLLQPFRGIWPETYADSRILFQVPELSHNR